MAAVGENSWIAAVDGLDEPIGLVKRRDVFTAHANFRVAHVFVFAPDGRLLIQQLSFTRLRHPGYWGSSVAAYVDVGENYLDAAHRRLQEEIGISSASLYLVGKTSMLDEGSVKFIELFAAYQSVWFNYDRDVINQLEFLSISQIRELQRTSDRKFTPTFVYLLDYYEANKREA